MPTYVKSVVVIGRIVFAEDVCARVQGVWRRKTMDTRKTFRRHLRLIPHMTIVTTRPRTNRVRSRVSVRVRIENVKYAIINRKYVLKLILLY